MSRFRSPFHLINMMGRGLGFRVALGAILMAARQDD
jgi:hypothetical protein